MTSSFTPVQEGIQERGAFGSDLARCFGLDGVPTHVQRTLRRDLMAVSQVRVDHPGPELTGSIAAEDAYLITVHQKELLEHELWLDGRLATTAPLRSGATYIYEIERDPRARLFQPAETLHFYLPRNSMKAFAEQHDLAHVADLSYTPGVGTEDPVILQMTRVIVELFKCPDLATGLLFDQILNAVCARMLIEYGQSRPPSQRALGLAAWQVRRAKDLMDDRLDISLADIALNCRLSVTHLVRGFRQSTGMTPHQWLLGRRIDRAMSMLADPNVTIAETALACGFSSQSHLNRAFTAQLGAPPGRWRRTR